MKNSPLSNRIEGLDLLRFGAAFIVLLYHYFFIGPLQGYWPHSQFYGITHFGDFGVDIFFVISGLVISLSAEGRTFKQFAKSRFTRIIPAFFVCSIITAASSSLLPGTSVQNIVERWLISFTFFPQLAGSEFLSGVYWTLQIEIKFYIIVSILILLGVWEKYKFHLLPLWLLLALINSFYLHNHILDQIFITEYAGHFAAGILLYQMKKEETTSFTPLGLVLSGILIWKHIAGFESWINGSFHQSYSEFGTFLIAPIIIFLVYWVAGIKIVPIPKKLLSTLGAMSYTLYLMHADFGFFLRAFSDRWMFAKFPDARYILTDEIIVSMAIVSSLTLAAFVSIYCEPPLKRFLWKILNREFMKSLFKSRQTIQEKS